MPDLSTDLHVKMLVAAKRKHSIVRRIARSIRKAMEPHVYGLQWGVIEDVPPLLHTLEHWLRPYVKPDQIAVEIGPGGGRWTKHLLGFRQVYAVDYYEPVLAELKANFGKHKNVTFIRNNGTDFPGIPDHSVDFLFSFGAFVHMDLPVIESYLDNIPRIMKPGGNVVIHYSDQNKIMAQESTGFSHNTPELMRAAVLARGYRILQEDTTSLWHSSLIRLTTGSTA